MSPVKVTRVLGRRLRWVGLAGAALLACAAPSEDVESDEGAASATTKCEGAQAAFISGTGDFDKVRATCDQEVADYTKAQAQNFDWFKNSPLGVSGPPMSLLLAMMKDKAAGAGPNIWPDAVGLGAHPDKDHAKDPLPYGLVTVTNPTTKLRHAFFSCAGCHTGRVIGTDGQIKFVYGAPNTEVDAQMFGWRVRDSMLGRPAGVDADGKAYPAFEGYALVTRDSAGNIVKDEEGLPKFTLTSSGQQLQDKAIWQAANLDGPLRDAVEGVVYGTHWDDVMRKLVAGAVRTDTLYGTLTKVTGSYPEGDPKSPRRVGPRPGMMDAYGFASGLVFTHANRDDYFAKVKARYGSEYLKHPFFAGGNASMKDADLFALARKNIQGNPANWLTHEPAPVDVKSLFYVADRPNVGWDGNQATSARVIASGTSSVGDPWNVNLPIHHGMDQFIQGLPPAAYPFKVDSALAKPGAKLFKDNCASCHTKGNAKVYPLAEIGTNPNRANVMTPIARAGLIELMRQTCDGTGDTTLTPEGKVSAEKNISLLTTYATEKVWPKGYSNDWCTPKGPNGEKLSIEQQDDALFRKKAMKGDPSVGYKADDLRGIWVQAPYLHNGSVPTLWHLLNPSKRPAKFVRGNINFDQEKVGFVWDVNAPKPTNYPTPRVVAFDATLRGQSNVGHTYGEKLSDDEKKQLIEYLKTL